MAAIAAETFMKTSGIHAIQIKVREPLRRNDGCPPLITDNWHVHGLKELKRHIRLDNRIRLPILEYVASQLRKPGFLVFSRGDRGFQLFFRHVCSASRGDA